MINLLNGNWTKYCKIIISLFLFILISGFIQAQDVLKEEAEMSEYSNLTVTAESYTEIEDMDQGEKYKYLRIWECTDRTQAPERRPGWKYVESNKKKVSKEYREE